MNKQRCSGYMVQLIGGKPCLIMFSEPQFFVITSCAISKRDSPVGVFCQLHGHPNMSLLGFKVSGYCFKL